VAGSDGSSGERGLLGIAVDPQWPQRPYVYLYHSHVSHHGHVTRLEASGALGDPLSVDLALGEPYTVFDQAPDFAPWHHGGTVRFGNDGKLYVSLGDNLSRCDAQGFASLAGTILRLEVSTLPDGPGGPPPLWEIAPDDNPLRGPALLPRLVRAWGFRNPFRFTVDPLTGDLFVGDVGESRWEEVDVLASDAIHGGNFGWPQREGPVDAGLGEKCGEGRRFVEPVFAYAHETTEPASIVCGPVYRMPQAAADPPWFPPAYEGSLFLIDHSNGVIRHLVRDGDTWSIAPEVAGQPSAEHWAEGIPWISDFQQGPDGALWLMKRDTLTWGMWRIARTAVTGAAVPDAHADAEEVAVAPNPARSGSGVVVRWSMPGSRAGTLRVVDVGGRAVRTIKLPPASQGTATWDGRDSSGSPVRSGVYFVRIEAEAGRAGVARVCVR
jgi:glucose/arabinose dehydrogenase